MERVRVVAPSHVHVGNFDLHGGIGRLYGTIGFSLDNPRVVVEVKLADREVVEGVSARRDLRGMVRRASGICNSPLHVNVLEEIPPHVGLGSTTALALSIAYGASVLCRARMSVEDLAVYMGRGSVSALGVHSFKYGGFIVDGGFSLDRHEVPPLIFRAHVPSRFLMVVALPERPIKELLEIKSREEEILESMPRMNESMAMEASRIALMGIISYASEGRWDSAGKWITVFNRRLGEYWSVEQKGIYCCREAEELVELMIDNGAILAAQSSWGPTVYGLAESSIAGEIAVRVKEKLDEMGGGRLWVTRVNNRGAIVELL